MSFYHSPRIVTNGLVLCLDAGNTKSYTSGSLIWNDLSGNNYSGSLISGAYYTGSNCGSIVFDGINDYVSCGTTLTLDFTNSLTLATWVKSSFDFGTRVGFSAVICRMVSNGYELGFCGNFLGTSNKLYFHVGGAYASNALISNTTINDGIWHYLVGTYNGTSSSIYIDGVNVGSSPKTNNLSLGSNTFKIGVNYTDGLFFSGSISSVQTYNRALSASEVLQNYNAMKGRFGIN